MSTVRTTFCTLVARGYGAGRSPRKKGLNGTIPAMTSSSVGSEATRLPLGTAGCSRCSKCARKRRRISAVCIGSRGPYCWSGWQCTGPELQRVRIDHIVRPVQAERRTQFVLPLRHALPDVREEILDGDREPVRQVVRLPLLRSGADPPDDEDADG